jgi:hypothetical protein
MRLPALQAHQYEVAYGAEYAQHFAQIPIVAIDAAGQLLYLRFANLGSLEVQRSGAASARCSPAEPAHIAVPTPGVRY